MSTVGWLSDSGVNADTCCADSEGRAENWEKEFFNPLDLTSFDSEGTVDQEMLKKLSYNMIHSVGLQKIIFEFTFVT